MNLLFNYKSQSESVLGGILLIAGCCIGAGMLGLPIITSSAGFIPSSVMMLLCCLYMMITGLLLLEATLWYEDGVSFISIVSRTLGKKAMAVTWILFLFVLYCLIVAYTSFGGDLISKFLSELFQRQISRNTGIVLCVAFVGCLIYSGTHAVDHVNRVFVLGLTGSYAALMLIGASQTSLENLHLDYDWKVSLATIPILLVSFGYQNLVPSLTFYLKRNAKKLRLAIVLGCLLPFVVYLMWNAVILGLMSLASGERADVVEELLKIGSHSSYVSLFLQTFAFFALMTSFLGNALSCVDFLADGLQTSFRLMLCLFVLVPPLLIAMSYPDLFLTALTYAGGVATVTLFGIFPTLVVWIGRYQKKMEFTQLVPGGKVTLICVFLLSVLFIGLEISKHLGGRL